MDGRYNGRIKDGKLTIDGIEYQLDHNENGNTLHGGRGGVSTRYFDYKILEDKETLQVVFHYESPHLDAGFPEKCDIYVRYLFLKHFDFPIFYVVFEAYPERQTVMKLTNHTYWCLGDYSIKSCSLLLYSNQYATYDENLIYKGMKQVNKYPIFDEDYLFYLLKEDWKGGIDNYFAINKKHEKNKSVLIFNSALI